VELVGKESVDGNPAYKFKLMRPSGSMVDIFPDVRTSLEVKRGMHAQSPDGETHIER
jgi:hypothetical protein